MTTYASVYPAAHSSTYVKSTSSTALFSPWFATDPANSVIGAAENNAFRAGATTNIKVCIDLGSAKYIARVYLENLHWSGGTTDQGVKDFSVYGTNSAAAFANTTYDDLTDLTFLGAFSAAQHSAADAPDPQYFDLALLGVAYQYGVIRCANNHGGTDTLGFRRIELQEISSAIGDIETGPVGATAAGGGTASIELGSAGVTAGGAGVASLSAGGIGLSGSGGATASMEVPAVGVSGAGDLDPELVLSSTFPGFEGGFSAEVESAAAVVGAFPSFTGGFQIDEIAVAGTFPEFTGGVALNSEVLVEISGTFPVLAGGATVFSDSLVALASTFPEFSGGAAVTVNHTFSLGSTFPSFTGGVDLASSEPAMALGSTFPPFTGGVSFDSTSCSGVLTYTRATVC